MTRKRRGPVLPDTVPKLAAWLKGAAEGKKLLGELTEKTIKEALEERCRKCEQAYRARPKVLVVVRRLGPKPGVEVYAERNVSVKMMELFDTHDDTKFEVVADEALAIMLPRSWKHLLPDHCPDVSLRQPTRSMVFTGATVERTIRSLQELRILRELGAWREKWLDKPR